MTAMFLLTPSLACALSLPMAERTTQVRPLCLDRCRDEIGAADEIGDELMVGCS